ncbi:hypothetical protein [Euhalothece natronophila]|nr:hypothetical protein [Euhalothece natronophila]
MEEQLTSSSNTQEEKPAFPVIPSEELSEEAKLKLEIIQSLLEPCD